MNHAGNTIASQSGSTYSIYLSSRIVNLLADRESDSILIAISKEMLATELLLPLLVILDFGSQTSGLTFVVKPIKSGLERMKKRRPTHEKGGNAYRHE